MESGSRKNAAIAIAIGTTPPTTNTDSHPNRGMMAAATNPPTAAPRENPQIIAVTAPARRRRGMYSDVNAMAFGMAPPMPSPVRTRNVIRRLDRLRGCGEERANAENQHRGDEDWLAADSVGERDR